jgi:hypothetical protein
MMTSSSITRTEVFRKSSDIARNGFDAVAGLRSAARSTAECASRAEATVAPAELVATSPFTSKLSTDSFFNSAHCDPDQPLGIVWRKERGLLHFLSVFWAGPARRLPTDSRLENGGYGHLQIGGL